MVKLLHSSRNFVPTNVRSTLRPQCIWTNDEGILIDLDGPTIVCCHVIGVANEETPFVVGLRSASASGPHLQEWANIIHKNFKFPHIKIVYPSAPLQPYTPACMQPSTVWFDRADISLDAPEKVDSVANIRTEVKNLIRKENDYGIPNNRIIVGGFSMGGALALYTGYHWQPDVAGVFAFGSFLNKNSIVYKSLQSSATNRPPLLQLHGDSDDLVLPEWGHYTFNELQSNGVKGDFYLLERLGHSLNRKGLQIIKDWIEKQLPEM